MKSVVLSKVKSQSIKSKEAPDDVIEQLKRSADAIVEGRIKRVL